MSYRDDSKNGEYTGMGLLGALVLGGVALAGKAVSNSKN